MESQRQATQVREAVNLVIDKLLDGKGKLNGGAQMIMFINAGVAKVKQTLWPQTEVVDDRIIDYLVYQLYRKREKEFALRVNELFSDYAIEKYRLQFIQADGKSGMNYYINQWLKSADLSRERLVKMIEKPKPNPLTKYLYVEAEELIKKRFYNTDMGMMMCYRATTGFAPKSEACQGCKFQTQCKQFTDKTYPELLRLRMKDYENGKEK